MSKLKILSKIQHFHQSLRYFHNSVIVLSTWQVLGFLKFSLILRGQPALVRLRVFTVLNRMEFNIFRKNQSLIQIMYGIDLLTMFPLI